MATHQQLCRQFSLDEIKAATNNFNSELIIGRGGFGFVYAGLINNGAKFVAIKRLSPESHQGETEFLREIEMLSRVQHHNLVCLEGYCNESPEKILVYEYMPKGTLVDHLYKTRGSATNTGDNQPHHLTWEERLNISIGAAQGLDFLHNIVVPGIIHRDIKDSNILLDSNLTAKIADFGLAKLVKMTNDSMINSASTTLVKGSFGYLDPEYFYSQRLTIKTDVYAFGVVLLVLLSGRPAVDNKAIEDKRSLAKWATECIVKKRLDQIIDPNLVVKISSKSLKQFVKIAQKCLCTRSEERPTMKEVVAGLQLALDKLITTSNTSSKQSGGMSSLTQIATRWNVKFDTKKNDPSGSHDIHKHSGGIPQFKGVVKTLQLAQMKQPTTSGGSSRQLGGRTSLTQTVEAKLKILAMAKKKEMSQVMVDETMDKKVLNNIIRKLLETELQGELSEAENRQLCVSAGQILLSEPSLLEVEAPITICGDMHGQPDRLLKIFEFGGFPPSAVYLFLGNYDSLGTIWLLLAYKILYPDKIFLLRGNHEDVKMNYYLHAGYDDKMRREKLQDCFNSLPVAALVDDKIFCVHGGLSPELKHVKQINELRRPTRIPNKGLLRDLLWSHPSSLNYRGNSDSGSFGADKVAEFLQTNDLGLICRGHDNEVNIFPSGKEEAFEFFAECGLVSILSIPYYNAPGGILSVDESLMCSFRTSKFHSTVVDGR